nr:hypothetical protein [Tanacetum cinerariifolium]
MLTMRARRFLKKTRRKLTVNGNDTIRFGKSNVDCYNCHKKGHFARECRALKSQYTKHKESTRRTVPVEIPASTTLVSCDGLGCYDWSDQAEEGLNYTLMAYTSTNCRQLQERLGYENYNAVPPPYTANFMHPKPDLSFTRLDEFANKPVVENCDAKISESKPKDVRKNTDALIIKEWVSDDEEEAVIQPKVEKKAVKTSIAKIEFVKPKQPKNKARKTVKNVENLRQNTHRPRGNMSYLIDYEEIDGGYVAFGGNPKGGKITGKVNTAYYVQNRVLVVKPYNKTPYELFHGRTPALSFMRPFGCPVTILNTLDHLGKFDGKSDEGFFVGYSMNSKYFRVFNSRKRIVEENMHIRFSENTPNIIGSGPDWLFDIDALTRIMNYEPIAAGTQSNGFVGTKLCDNAGQARKDKEPVKDYILLPLWTANPPFSQDPKSSQDDGFQPSSDSGKKVDEDRSKECECKDQEQEDNVNSTNNVNTASTNGVDTVSENIINEIPFDLDMPALEDINEFNLSSDHEDDDKEADMNNMDTTIQVSHVPTTRTHKDHLLDQVIRDLHSTTQTRNMSKNLETMGFLPLFIKEQTIKTFKIVYLLAFYHKKNPKRIEAIRLFLAYASFKDFVMYQMDVKSAFHYRKIKEEFYGYSTPPDEGDTAILPKCDESDLVVNWVYRINVVLRSSVKFDSDLDFEGVADWYQEPRSHSDPTLLNNSKMVAERNGDLPVPDLQTMEELCQPSLNGRDESLFEAWERYKLSIDRCPNHNMLHVTQIDTFYNDLTLRHHDTINAAAGGTFMKRSPEECYDLIENMTAHHNNWDTSAQRMYTVEKVLYRLHQAPRAWYEALSTYLLDNGFNKGKIDKTLFIRRHKGNILLVQVYADDIIFSSTKKELCNVFGKMMHEKFQMGYMGELTFFLGFQVKQKQDRIFISQDKYVTKIIKKYRFSKVRNASTPIETQKPLLKDEDDEEVDVHMYRSMISLLMYLTSLRPDIMFAVCACARYQVNPKVSHLFVMDRIFRYLKGQLKFSIWYSKDSPFDLVAYTDSDYAGASLDRKSTTGEVKAASTPMETQKPLFKDEDGEEVDVHMYRSMIGSLMYFTSSISDIMFVVCACARYQVNPKCKKQIVVVNSTTEAEYVAASSCHRQVLWIQNQLLDY